MPVKTKKTKKAKTSEVIDAPESPIIKTEAVENDEIVTAAGIEVKTEPKTENEDAVVGEVTSDDNTSVKKEIKTEPSINTENENGTPGSSSTVKDEKPPIVAPEHITSLATLGPFLAKHDNWRNYDYITNIPQICKDEPCMLGIDEAGRGPVLGPMVYGIAFCPLSQTQHLKTLGCADSKQLSEKDREKIFNNLTTQEYANTNIGWAIDVISPSYISEKMLSRVKVSLNEISMSSAIGLVNKAIDAGVNIAEVYVDTVGPPEKYQAKLSALFPDFQITVAKKADSTYPIVSAASICAKVSRDHSLRVWTFPEGLKLTHEDFGSGYPGDPKTKAFLEDNVDRVFGFPRIVRFSWATARNVLKRKALPMIFPDAMEELEKKKKAAQSIKKFLKKDEDEYEPCQYFKDRYLSHTFEF